jgi:hypothetical protein
MSSTRDDVTLLSRRRAHGERVALDELMLLIDHACARRAAKRGAEIRIEQLIDSAIIGAITGQYPRQAELVEPRYFGGPRVEETTLALKLSPETVARDWRRHLPEHPAQRDKS